AFPRGLDRNRGPPLGDTASGYTPWHRKPSNAIERRCQVYASYSMHRLHTGNGHRRVREKFTAPPRHGLGRTNGADGDTPQARQTSQGTVSRRSIPLERDGQRSDAGKTSRSR
ncbi:MAG: hypothetical protein ACK55I_34405, partial [bacterium]